MTAISLPDVVQAKAAALGQVGKNWIESLSEVVQYLENRWDIRVGESLAGGTHAYVTAVQCADGTPAVLKISMPDAYDGIPLENEIIAMTLAEGNGYANVIRHNLERRAILMERLGPSLASLGLPPSVQMETICHTLRRSWIPVPNAPLQTGLDIIDWFVEFIASGRERYQHPMLEAAYPGVMDALAERADAFDPQKAVLVHGDAHSHNTLLSPAGEGNTYKFVDPDGLAAEPAYDVGVLMREWPDTMLKSPLVLGLSRCARLQALTGAPEAAIWQWGIIQCVATGLVHLGGGNEADATKLFTLAQAWIEA